MVFLIILLATDVCFVLVLLKVQKHNQLLAGDRTLNTEVYKDVWNVTNVSLDKKYGDNISDSHFE